ncbi:MAG: hypothetical protein ACPKPY_09495 [Nitrososphaeraceae archaeon]
MRLDAKDNIENIRIKITDSKEPLTQNRICKLTRLSRETVRNHLPYLIDKGIVVKIEGKHPRHPKYKIADNIDPQLFELELYDKIFEPGQFNNIFNLPINHKKLNKFMDIKKDYDTLFKDKELYDELKLSEFANKIGAYILYIFINILIPNKWSLKSTKGYSAKIEMKKSDKDILVERWIKNTIDVKFMFDQFCSLEFVSRGLKLLYPVNESYDQIQNTIKTMIIKDLSKKDKERFKHDPAFRNSIKVKIREYAKKQYDYFQNRNNLDDYDMAETEHKYLMKIFKSVYPEIFEWLENRKKRKRQYLRERRSIRQQLYLQEQKLEQETGDDENTKETIKLLREKLSDLRRNRIYYN